MLFIPARETHHPEKDSESFMAEFFATPAILVFLLKELESGAG
jgi:hypothetical protein